MAQMYSSDQIDETLESNSSTSFSTLYKNTQRATNSQKERRLQILENLKSRRKDLIDCKRGISDIFDSFENEEAMEVCPDPTSQIKKKKARMAYKLMLSEWFTDIPEDLEDNWLMKFCPVGVRNIVIADKGKTKIFSRTGQKQFQCKSLLPGGSSKSLHNSEFTILDCIWERQRNIYFILDVIAWGTLSLMDCDAEFRFYWLQSKFQENLHLGSISQTNEAQFYPLPYDKANRSLLQQYMSTSYVLNNDKTPIDGLLFYHKDCHYLKGFTPLVGWLKPFMLPSELGIEINDEYLENVPMDYINLETYLATKEPKKKHHNRKK